MKPTWMTSSAIGWLLLNVLLSGLILTARAASEEYSKPQRGGRKEQQDKIGHRKSSVWDLRTSSKERLYNDGEKNVETFSPSLFTPDKKFTNEKYVRGNTPYDHHTDKNDNMLSSKLQKRKTNSRPLSSSKSFVSNNAKKINSGANKITFRSLRDNKKGRSRKSSQKFKYGTGFSSALKSKSSSSSFSSYLPNWYRKKPMPRSSRPNIVVIMTDDQDVLLGSLKAMPKLHKLMTRQGVFFNNSFVPTPMCCPSRSSFLTGMYVHNHNVYSNNDNCSSFQWQQRYESRSFATYINSTYNTGYFGKYLNEYNGSHIPSGWQRWVGLIKNSHYYNYSVINERMKVVKHGDNYYKDYLTDLVANDSCTFLLDSKKHFPHKPVMMMLSVPAPHGPEDAAPQYQHMFVNNSFHRTPTWNLAPNPDKQWLLKNTPKMIPQFKLFTDLLQRRRLQTLQSVDDLVEKVVDQLSVLGELSNTYIIYTSDHGYHLGQFGLIKGKAMPFDFDTRVPLIIRGPGIRPGTVISNIVSNIDLAPTILDMAGQPVPPHMDGQSVMRLIRSARDRKNVDSRGFVSSKKPWRDSILLEKGKLTPSRLRQRMRTEEMIMLNQISNEANSRLTSYIPPKTHRLARECYQGKLPCKPKQKWYCIEDNGLLRKYKCPHWKHLANSANLVPVQGDAPFSTNKTCRCPPQQTAGRKQRRRQQLRRRKAERAFQAQYSRMKRSVLTRPHTSVPIPGLPQMTAGSPGFSGSMFSRRCRILSNQSVLCDLDIYRKTEAWASHKQRIDDMIKEYRKALDDLRDIRRHLINQRPPEISSADIEDEAALEMAGFGDYDGSGRRSEDCNCRDKDMIDLVKERKNIKKLPKDSKERRRLKKKLRRLRKRNRTRCRDDGMQCFTHDNNHWKTPPYWKYGPFCFCPNANNNTYWCVRTINQTHDFHYCEFITTFMSFYDLRKDPFQLKNTVMDLNYGILQQLHEQLKKLKQCSGAKDCFLRSSQKNRLPHDPNWAGLVHLRRESKSFNRKLKTKDLPTKYTDKEDEEDFWLQNFDNAPDYE